MAKPLWTAAIEGRSFEQLHYCGQATETDKYWKRRGQKWEVKKKAL